MISREQMQPERAEYLDRPAQVQLERIGDALDRVAKALVNAPALADARDDVDRMMAYTDWTAHVLDDDPLVDSVADCHRLMARLRAAWSEVEASSELRRWIRLDVLEMRNRLRHAAKS